MKRRFVFISRFSIAGGLASGAVVEQFPACMSVCLCLYVCARDSVSSARALCLSGCMCVYVLARMYMHTSVRLSLCLEKPVSS